MMNTIQLCGIEFAAKPKEELINETHTPPVSVSENNDTSVTNEQVLVSNTRKKFPRLNELYGKLFDVAPPNDLHNSIIDVLVCLRCFLKVRGAKEMTEDEFQVLVEKHSRPHIYMKNDTDIKI